MRGERHHDEIRKVQDEFDRAELNGDTETLRRLIGDGFLSIGPKKFVLDNEGWIGRHVHFKYLALETSEMDVRLYGRAAIVRTVQKNTARYKDEEVRLTVRVGQVWVRTDGGDRLVAIQFSPMPHE
jgi:hypothetical protein